MGCRVKGNSPDVGSGPVGRLPSMGDLSRDPSPHLREIRRKPRKTSNGLVDNRDGGLNQFERRTAQPLVGLILKEK